jgi:hypothetical protein
MDEKSEIDEKMNVPEQPDQTMETIDPGQTIKQEKPVSGLSSENEKRGWIDRADIESLRTRWSLLQAQFVDDPRIAVEKGDELVAETIGHIERRMDEQHRKLNQQISNHNDLSTESLRVLLQEYRTLFNRLMDL